MSDKHLKLLAKLQAKVIITEAQIRANPMPHIQKLSDEIIRLYELLDEISYIVSTDYKYDLASSMNIEPVDFIGESLSQVNKVKGVLAKV